VSESDRELRDRLEAAQSELKRALARLDELETVASDRDVLRGQLEVAQAELKVANERLAELEAQSVEALEEELDEIARDREQMRQRLEQADKTREQWDGKLAAREAELAAARAEQWRLSEELARQKQPAPVRPAGPPRWVFGLPVLGAIAAALAVLRGC